MGLLISLRAFRAIHGMRAVFEAFILAIHNAGASALISPIGSPAETGTDPKVQTQARERKITKKASASFDQLLAVAGFTIHCTN